MQNKSYIIRLNKCKRWRNLCKTKGSFTIMEGMNRVLCFGESKLWNVLLYALDVPATVQSILSLLLSVAGFAETSSWPTTYSTVALTCNRMNFWGASRARPSRTRLLITPPQFSLTPEKKQPSLRDFPSRGINSRWKWSTLLRLTLSSNCWA